MGRAARIGFFYHDMLIVGAIFIRIWSNIMIDKLQVGVNKMILNSHLGSFLGESLVILNSSWEIIEKDFTTSRA